MNKFQELKEEVAMAEVEAEKFFINENMQAGKRYFASLMRIQAKCKDARKELSESRKTVRDKRNGLQKV